METTVQTQAQARPARKYRFRVLAGSHYRGSKEAGNLERYVEGDVFEESYNISRRHQNKFVRVDDHTPLTDPKENELPLMGLPEDHFDRMDVMEDTSPDYESMTTKQLRHIARSKQIDLTGVKSKREVVSMLQAADALAEDEE